MIDIELCEGLLFIPIFVAHGGQEKSLHVILDTGSAGSAIDINVIRPDFSREAVAAEIVGVGGSQPVVIQQVDRVTIGSAVFKDVPFEFGDLENSLGIEGIIGNDILTVSGAVINCSQMKLRFSRG